MEFAGEVFGAGSPGRAASRFGDRVMGIVGGGCAGGAARRARARAQARPRRDSALAQAGGLPEVFDHRPRRDLHPGSSCRPGERLLVHGGAGGVCTAAIQLGAGERCGATATVRNEAAARAGGRARREAIAPEGFAEHGPFDVILELVGASQPPRRTCGPRECGRIGVIGVSAGAKSELNLPALMGKRARIYCSTLRARPLEEKALAARCAGARGAARTFEDGPLRCRRRDVSAERAAAAYDPLAAGGKLGKIVPRTPPAPLPPPPPRDLGPGRRGVSRAGWARPYQSPERLKAAQKARSASCSSSESSMSGT